MTNPLMARRRLRDRTRALLAAPTGAMDGKVTPATARRPALVHTDIRNVIDASAIVDGNLTTAKSIMVDGTVHGNLTVLGSAHLAVVRTGAVVEGDLTADLVLVAGTVRGGIHARALRITATGCVRGQVSADRLGVDPGATLTSSSLAVGFDGTVRT